MAASRVARHATCIIMSGGGLYYDATPAIPASSFVGASERVE